ncbi:MAG: ABC transporter ATP-binding protein [Lentisphaeria bacterium]|nr:ABC transporter ATP-binding protein [Lentisphaeria bacterium]
MSSDNDIIVSARNLCKSFRIYREPYHRLLQYLPLGKRKLYREVQAVKDCSFDVKRGECVGIIGRNGAGKSTILQLLAETVVPTSGKLTIRGRIAALLELGSGFNPEFTGRENIFMYGAILGLSPDAIRERYESIVDFADIGDAVEQPVKTYSSGMAMRLAFAVVAHVDADILIIDEALAVGDVVFVQKCYAFLREFMRKHTVILVTHDIAAVRDLCDRAIWLESGRIAEDGNPAKVTDDYLARCCEVRQGASAIGSAAPAPKQTAAMCDVRKKNWEEHPEEVPRYEFFSFDENAPSFGKGGARIRDIHFTDLQNRTLNECTGGERVRLVMDIAPLQELESPIVGFAFRNSRGENIFGDNTYEVYRNDPQTVVPGETLRAVFEFEMPRLPPGEYALHAAIADGTQDEHIQHQWFHNALTILSCYHGKIGVMVGIPMHRILLRKVTNGKEEAR